MAKRILRGAVTGALAGISLNYMILLGMSLVLRMGYFAPCLTTLRELTGGEMNGVVTQLLLFVWLGVGMGLAWALGGRNGRTGRFRAVSATICAVLALAPMAVMAYVMLFSRGSVFF